MSRLTHAALAGALALSSATALAAHQNAPLTAKATIAGDGIFQITLIDDGVNVTAANLVPIASGLRNPTVDFEETQPQLSLTVDRAKADDLGIGVETIAVTLQTMLASREMNCRFVRSER